MTAKPIHPWDVIPGPIENWTVKITPRDFDLQSCGTGRMMCWTAGGMMLNREGESIRITPMVETSPGRFGLPRKKESDDAK